VPDSAWVFDSWSDGLTGSENPDTIVVASDTTVTATFIRTYTVATNVVGNGSVTKTPDQATYLLGDTVVVTAVPDSAWVFDGWSDGLTGSENPDTIVVTSDTTVIATFVRTYAVITNVVGNGSVTKAPDQAAYLLGDTVIVTALPDSAWVFNSWSDGLTGTDNPDTIVVASDTTVTATFVPQTYAVTTNVVGNGSVTKIPDQGTYAFGDTVVVTALPDSAWVFDSWSDGLSGTENPDTLVVNCDTMVTATFTEDPTGIRETILPKRLELFQNRPNPFNPTTVIEFALDRETRVVLSIYDVTGKELRRLVDRRLPVGFHKEVWDGRDRRGNKVATGVYFYRLHTSHRTLTRKAVLLK
ncbi:MAG: T9SS type A sorting domain-containing protein, partial [Candidatus Latescibacterota bacterium]